MEEKIMSICGKYCEREIGPDEELIKSKLISSFNLLEMICELEAEFGLEFQPEEIQKLEHFSTVSNIVALVRTRKGTAEE